MLVDWRTHYYTINLSNCLSLVCFCSCVCPLSNEKASKARKDVQGVYEGISVLRYYALHLFLYFLFFFSCYCFSAWSRVLSLSLSPQHFIPPVSSLPEVQYFSGLEIVWLQFLCPVHTFYVFVGGLFISFFSVSLLLKSCVNIYWRAWVAGWQCMFLLVAKGRCQFVVLEIYWLLHWFFHSNFNC